MKLPETLARLNAELRRRHAAGLSTDIVDLDAKPMVDEHVGVFMRYVFHLSDGGCFSFDSREMPSELRTALRERAMQ